MAIIDCDWWLVRRKLDGVSGSSYNRNPTLRMRATPCNSNRSRQQTTRAVYAYCLWAWANVLTAGDREVWDDDAEVATWRDYLEQYKHLLGFQWFVAFNTRLLRGGLPMNVDDGVIWWGNDVASLSVSFLSSTSIRVTFTPAMDQYNHLVVFMRGPLSLGVEVKAPVWTWQVSSTPRGWRWVGVSAIQATSPQDFTLPCAFEVGQRIGILGGGMDETGAYCQQWRAAEALRV